MPPNVIGLLTAALKDSRGISPLEYVVLGAGILGAALTALATFEGPIRTTFGLLINNLG